MPRSAPDVLVVGAGTAGATLAWKLASVGVSVLLVDRAPAEKLGRPWRNGVEARLFADLDLGPLAPEIVAERTGRFILASPSDQRVVVESPPIFEVNMRPFNQMLVEQVRARGGEVRLATALTQLEVDEGRVVGAYLSDDPSLRRFRCVVHAAGRRPLPGAEALGPMAPGGDLLSADLCVSAQEVRHIDDLSAATRHLKICRLESGDTLSRSGGAGAYAVANFSLDLETGTASFLTGAMHSQGPRTARRLMDEMLAEMPFVGERLWSGGGLIPVRRPFDRLVAPGLALLGDAASQVYPAHGSGVATGMRAANLLAQTLSGALRSPDPVDLEALWPYAAIFMRSRGALCAGSEVIRRVIETLGPGDLDHLMSSGLLDAEAVHATLGCFPFRPRAASLPRRMSGLLRGGKAGRRLMGAMIRSTLLEAHYRTYPPHPFHPSAAGWARRAAWLVSDHYRAPLVPPEMAADIS